MAKGGGGSRGGSRGGGGSSGGGGAGSLNSLDKFAPAVLEAIKEVRDSGNQNLAVIADVRDKIGDRASREAFDANLKAMQARGEVQTVTGKFTGDLNRAQRDGITTSLGEERLYVRIGT